MKYFDILADGQTMNIKSTSTNYSDGQNLFIDEMKRGLKLKHIYICIIYFHFMKRPTCIFYKIIKFS